MIDLVTSLNRQCGRFVILPSGELFERNEGLTHDLIGYIETRSPQRFVVKIGSQTHGSFNTFESAIRALWSQRQSYVL